MGLKIGTWNVAFRERSEKYIYDDISRKFSLIKNGRFGWAADPFLFDYRDETYLFVEFFSYKTGKGEIAYARYNKKKFEKYKTIILEPYHMSYPLVFEYNDNVYMMPQTSGDNSLYLYKAIDFPKKMA